MIHIVQKKLTGRDYVACLIAIAGEAMKDYPHASAKDLVELAHFKLQTQRLSPETRGAWFEKQLAERYVA